MVSYQYPWCLLILASYLCSYYWISKSIKFIRTVGNNYGLSIRLVLNYGQINNIKVTISKPFIYMGMINKVKFCVKNLTLTLTCSTLSTLCINTWIKNTGIRWLKFLSSNLCSFRYTKWLGKLHNNCREWKILGSHCSFLLMWFWLSSIWPKLKNLWNIWKLEWTEWRLWRFFYFFLIFIQRSL